MDSASATYEPLVRMHAADLVGEEAVASSIATLRQDIADLSARLDVAEAVADTLPHRSKYLHLSHRLVRRLLQLHLDWVDEVERELGQKPKRTKRSGVR